MEISQTKEAEKVGSRNERSVAVDTLLEVRPFWVKVRQTEAGNANLCVVV